MSSRICQRSKLPFGLLYTSFSGPMFPRPSRQLLEGIGWLTPTKISRCSRCFHLQVSKRQRMYNDLGDSSNVHSQALESLDAALNRSRLLLESDKSPEEKDILQTMRQLEELARHFKEGSTEKTGKRGREHALSFLEEKDDGKKVVVNKVTAAIQSRAVQKISEIAYTLVKDSKVFISVDILKAYVNIQSLLGKPESLAEVFGLYARKPIPVENTFPIRYAPAKPNKASSAVPPRIANVALESAIHVKNLPLCLDIVDATVCTPAFQRNKLIKKAFLPATAFASAPVAAWAVASQFSVFQENMSSQVATNIAFAGILSYVTFTSIIGYVALTTSNDQMDRITWADGMPLRERWLREEERAMMDRIAGAWGFRDPNRKGEEGGAEWEALKELVGLRGMVLDRVELMEGME